MRRPTIISLILLSSACRGAPPESRQPAPTAGPGTAETYGLATAAMRERDWATALRHVLRADSLAPDHPSIVRQLARVHARSGDTAAALATLRRLLPHGLSTGLDADSAFMPYAALPAFRALERELAANAAPIIRSDTSFRYGGPAMRHEGMTHVVRGRRAHFLLGAMSGDSARIVEIDAATAAARDVVPVTPGTFLGMKVDARGRLWVANVLGSAAGANPDRKSELRSYDVATGRLLTRHPSPEDGRPHLFNDLVVLPDGRVVLTDSDAGTAYLLRPGAERLEVLAPSTPDFSGLNGIALSRDGRTAFVAHLEGISAVRLSDGRRTRLRHAPGIATSGIDGMYRCGDRLIAIQAIVGHDRIAAFRLNARGDSIVALETLERSHPAYGFPATGTIVGDTLHYIARRRPAQPPAAGDTTSALVLRLPLGRCD